MPALPDIALTDPIIWGVVESAPDGIVVTNADGRILLVNRQAETLFGSDRSELVGQPVEELLPGELRQAHREHRTRYRVDPRTRPMGASTPLVGRRQDGTEFPVEISLSPLRVESDLLVVASVRDITARLATEAKTRQISELLDATRDAILIFDAETLLFTYVNEGAVEQVGYSREELLNMTMLHLAPEFTEDRLRELLEPLRRGDVSSTMFTTIHRRRDGTNIPVEIILQPGSTEEGKPSVFVKLARDVSERVEAEERFRQASEELRLLEDRERIARDLHDTVIQRLFAAGLGLQAVSTRVGTQDAAAAQRMDRIVDELDETIRDLRTAIYGLRDRTVGGVGLRHEILRILENDREALGTEPRLRLEGVIDAIPSDVGDELLATLREGLSNVARHAQATNVTVHIEVGDSIALRVIDDGIGTSERPSAGNGIRNMSERAQRLGGSFHVGSHDGVGTVIEWIVPNTVN